MIEGDARRFFKLIVLAVGLSLSANSLADGHAANVTELERKAFAVRAGGVTRTLQENDRVFEGEKIITGSNSSLVLVFTDKTKLTLGPSTIITVDSYKYSQQAGHEAASGDREEAFTTSIFAGVVRAVTGLLAKRKPRGVRFKTVVATIGVRGTHFAAEVEGERATVILLEQEDPDTANAIEVSNAYGSVEIDKPGYGTEVPDAQSPPSPPRKMKSTQTMNRILRSVNTTRRVIVPRAHMR